MDFFYADKCVADVVEAYIFVAVAVSVDLDGAVEEELVEVNVDAVSQEADSFADVDWDFVFAEAQVCRLGEQGSGGQSRRR